MWLQDYKAEEDPALFHSAKTGRGPLSPEWKVTDKAESGDPVVCGGCECSALVFPSQNELKSECPHMCAYKLVTVKFRWWGLQTKVENFIHKVEPGQYSKQHCSFSYSLESFLSFTARKTDFHKLSPPAVLLDRQMGGFDHGGHPADGRRDPKRARGGTAFNRPLSIVLIIAAFLQMFESGCECVKPDLSDLTLFTPEFHIRCVRRETCEGPLRQTSRSL